MITAKEVSNIIEAVYPKVVEFRRDLHMHPELSGEEVRTSARIQEELDKYKDLAADGRGGALQQLAARRDHAPHGGSAAPLRGGEAGAVDPARAELPLPPAPVARACGMPPVEAFSRHRGGARRGRLVARHA